MALSLAAFCAGTIALDEWRRPQKMAVMAVVGPLTALFGSVLWLAVNYRWGRAGDGNEDAPMAVSVLKGASHCGAGCALGDIAAEALAVAFVTARYPNPVVPAVRLPCDGHWLPGVLRPLADRQGRCLW